MRPASTVFALPRLNAALAETGIAYETIVVDTVHPIDDTWAICRRHGACSVARSSTNSLGDAVRTGLSAFHGRYVLFMDADGSHDPELIPTLYAHRDEFDIVVASRYVEGGETENRPILVWMSKILNVVYRKTLSIGCKDVSNSFKLYRRDVVEGLTLKCNNFDVVEELLFKAVQRLERPRIKEVPSTFRTRVHGQTKRKLAGFIPSYLFTLARLRFRDRSAKGGGR